VEYRFTFCCDAKLEFSLFENEEIILPRLLIDGRKLGGRYGGASQKDGEHQGGGLGYLHEEEKKPKSCR
jgi:hypothetical protein